MNSLICFPSLEADTTELRRVFDTNVIGLSICIREAVKDMRERAVDDGYIINIGRYVSHVLKGIKFSSESNPTQE